MEIQLWREFLSPYQLAVDELIIKFRHLKEEFNLQGVYSPIDQVEGRVKTIDSILDKLQKKDISMNDMAEMVEDIAGIRITCQFVEDIDRVVELIKERRDMEVQQEKDYIRNMKDSGYRSYHLIISYTVHTAKGPRTLPAEIQIR
ncbi:MAG: GTP pyrophosphokinase family protein, partial [Eubacterium sp.]|nr:GTP pyrophosphokinase family protein [Eubacterium sp.]